MTMDFSNIATYLEILTVIVLGVFSFITLYDRWRKGEQKTAIENFQATINSMEGRMNEMQLEIDERKREHQVSLEKIAHLNGENKVLRDLLMGRDPDSDKYRQRSETAMAQVDTMFKMIQSQAKLEGEQSELMRNMTTSVVSLGKGIEALIGEFKSHREFVKRAHPEVALEA